MLFYLLVCENLAAGIGLFINFESRATLIDLFFLQVITIGPINLSLSKILSFLLCNWETCLTSF